MSAKRMDWRGRGRRWLHSWQAPATLAAVLILCLAWWAMPRRIDLVMLPGAEKGWRTHDAPPRREIVWETPTPITNLELAAKEVTKSEGPVTSEDLIAPRLVDHGATLYFSRRVVHYGEREGEAPAEPLGRLNPPNLAARQEPRPPGSPGQCDIYRARRLDGAWQTPEPMAAWNSPSDDIGATLSADGQTAVLYSNRAGGLGGFDLYVSTKTDSGWSAPRNLGPAVNSPVHEYDPALGPDGRLFFSSNRTSEMSRQTSDTAGNPAPPDPANATAHAAWPATLRAHPGLTQFDLYVADTSPGKLEWLSPRPLTELNLAQSNEGAPCLTADGAFLYFASDRKVAPGDRPVKRNEPANLDLYRARWTGEQFAHIENLGREINSPAHETEPALSPEGYTLVFSSNRQGRDMVYASAAREVLHNTSWDTANLQALSRIWWRALLLTALLAGFLAAIWYGQGWIFQKAGTARFLAASVCLHCGILLLMMFVPLAKVVIELAQEIRVSNPATQMFDNNQHQSHETGLEAYEKLSDLAALQSQPLPEVQRQAVEPVNVPDQSETPILNLPRQLTRNTPVDRIEFVPVPAPPAEALTVRRPLELARATSPPPVAQLESDASLPTLPEAVPVEQSPAPTQPQVTRQQSAEMPIPKRAVMPREIAVARPLRAVKLPVATVEEIAELPDTDAAPLVARKAPQLDPVAETLTSESIKPAESAREMTAIERAPLPVARSEVAQPARPQVIATAAPQLATPLERTARTSVRPATLDVEQPAVVTTSVPLPSPQRAAQIVVEQASNPAALKTVGTEVPKETTVAKADLSLARGQQAVPDVSRVNITPTMRIQQQPRSTPPTSITAQLATTDNVANAAKIAVSQPELSPRNRGAASPSPSETVEPVKLADVPVKPGEGVLSPSSRAEVQLARVGQANPAAARETAPASTVATRLRANEPAETARQLQQAMTEARPAASTVAPPLAREATRPTLPSDIQRADVSPLLAAVVAPAETPTAGIPVALSRVLAAQPAPHLETLPELGGRQRRMDTRIIVGTLAPQRLDAPPSLSPLVSQLNRPRALAKPVAMAVDNVGMQAMFTLRQGETRKEFIDLFGGNQASEVAVNRGLEWLASRQNADGSWSLQTHEGATTSDTAATGFALLPFLAAGHTPQAGKYQPVVGKAVAWLVATQKPNGDLLSVKDNASHHMYAHGAAAIALCEVFGMTQAKELRDPAQRSLDFIAAAQHAPSGGWRYRPNEPGDTSVVGWQVMALKSGEMAGLTVPAQALEGAKRWLESVETNQPAGGHFGYANRGATPTMTAEGLLCVQFLGTTRNSPRMRAGADLLLKHLPQAGTETSYYWYYATQVMYHMQGEYWVAWNEKMRELLVNSQVKDGAHAGSWNPTDQWEKSGGRIYSTSIKLLMLEVYYRHLPLYQQLDQ